MLRLAVLWTVTLLLLLRIHLFPLFCSFTDAPFRLLAFADPQLEGDTSIWHAPREAPFRPQVFLSRLRDGDIAVIPAAISSATSSLIPAFAALRKRIDLIGNDYYLAHIYRTLHFWTNPTHVTVLGDLLGSQWISDEEFDRRSRRFWQIFRGNRVEMEDSSGPFSNWSRRIINIAGNHDVGYAGDLTVERLARFEREFGPANWEYTFTDDANLRLVVLNSMNLDVPAFSKPLQDDTYAFINRIIGNDTATIVLTHIPLHKDAGVCVDGPHFSFNEFGIREQNHLSYDGGLAILDGILGGRGLVLNGHDHEGCDVGHEKTDRWTAKRWDGTSPVREVTLRSMMGEFGGYAYLVSAWFDGQWHFEVEQCPAGVQHWWWAAHIMLLVSLLGSGVAVVI
jgi:hypothetical protein